MPILVTDSSGRLSLKAQSFTESVIREMTRLNLELNGSDRAINFAQGFPDFATDPRIVEAAAKAMRDGFNQYATTWGAPQLRKAIARKQSIAWDREIDPERQAAARVYLTRAGVIDRTDLRLEDAAAGLRELDGSVDMAFLDGLKGDYPEHLELILERVRPAGLVAIDNVLLTGTVAAGRGAGHWTDEHVERMREFNRRLVSDPRLTATVLPVGDGVAVAVRRADATA